jgi:protein-tyrosine phosphatase
MSRRRATCPDVIDLHCHILPGVDDGTRDDQEAFALARTAGEAGVTTIVATPHIDEMYGVDIVELLARVGALNSLLDAARIPVTVVPGGEVTVRRCRDLSDEELTLVSLGGASRWILLESPFTHELGEVTEAVESLLGRGFRPLLAHPERSPAFSVPEALASLIERGARTQVNAVSLLGGLGGNVRASAHRLLDARLVHAVASDSHRVGQRLGAYLSLVDRVLNNDLEVDTALVGAIRDAPEKILAGIELSAPTPRLRGSRRRPWLTGRRSI